jgi:O-antigen/teichoic acid export membrane protein
LTNSTRPTRIGSLTGRVPIEIVFAGTALVAVIAAILMTRVLSVADRGSYSAATTWAQTAGWLGLLSLDKAVLRRTENSSKASTQTWAWSCLKVMVVGIAACSGATALALAGPLDAPTVLLGVIAGAFAAGAFEFVGAYAYAIGQPVIYQASRILQSGLILTWAICLLAATSFLDVQVSASVAVWGTVLASALAVAGVVNRLRRLHSLPGRGGEFSSTSVARTAVRLHLPQVLSLANRRFDLLAAPFLLTLDEVGIYAVGAAAGRATAFLGNASLVRGLAHPKDKLPPSVYVLTVGVAVATLAAAPFAIPLVFGDSYTDAVRVAQLLALVSILDFVGSRYSGRLLGLHRERTVTFIQVASLAASGVVLLVGRSPIGLGLAYAAGSLTVAIFSWLAFIALYSRRSERRLHGRRTVPSAPLQFRAGLTGVGPRGVSFLLWVTSSILLLLWSTNATSWHATRSALGSILLISGCLHFLLIGGARLEVRGLASLSIGMFGGYAGIYWSGRPEWIATEWAQCCALVSLAALQGAIGFITSRGSAYTSSVRVATDVRFAPAGLGLTLAAVPVALAGSARLADPLVFAGIALLSLHAATQSTARKSARAFCLTAIPFFIYVGLVFSGFGRLNVVAALLTVCWLVVQRFAATRLLKACMLLMLPILLTVGGASRVDLQTELNPAYQRTDDGLGSVASPLYRYAQVLDGGRAGTIEPSNLRSVLAVPLFFVPRTIWPEKPEGFGSELVAFVEPSLASTSHSELALLLGEGLWTAGWLGAAASATAFLILLRRLARTYRFAVYSGSAGQWLGALVLSVSVPDLVWGGWFTYVTRAAPRFVVVVGVAWLLGRTVVANQERAHLRSDVTTG